MRDLETVERTMLLILRFILLLTPTISMEMTKESTNTSPEDSSEAVLEMRLETLLLWSLTLLERCLLLLVSNEERIHLKLELQSHTAFFPLFFLQVLQLPRETISKSLPTTNGTEISCLISLEERSSFLAVAI